MRYAGLLMLLLLSMNGWCDGRRFYLGGELAGAKLSDDGGMNDYQFADDNTGALRVFGGYQISPAIAAEIGIDWLGSYESQTMVSDIYNDYSALTFSLLGKMPLGENISVYAQLGFGFASIYQDVTAISGLIIGQASDTSAAGLFGAGFSFTIPGANELEIRAGIQQVAFTVRAYAMDNASNLRRNDYKQRIGEFYLGAAYHF